MLCNANVNVVLLDDDRLFLDTLSTYLTNNFKSDITLEAFDGLDAFWAHLSCYESMPTSISEHYTSYLEGQLSPLELLTTIRRYHPIFIIDNNLQSSMEGTEVCRRVKEGLPVSTIALLSGEVEYKTANTLHNEMAIDAFISKDDDLLSSKVCKILEVHNQPRIVGYRFDGEIPVHLDNGYHDDPTYQKKLSELVNEKQPIAYFIDCRNGDVYYQTQDLSVHQVSLTEVCYESR